jgi:hypothetical protein
MKTLFLLLCLLHGLIHLLGFARAFGLAELGQLTLAVSKPRGILWLMAAILCVGGAVLLFAGHPSWWIVAGVGVVLSQSLIIGSWADARFGTVANVIILVPVIISMLNALPSSYQNRYRTEVEQRLHPGVEPPLLVEEDLQGLPAAVQKYLRSAGAVGRPRVENFRVAFRGTMRQSPESPWREISSQQYNFVTDPARLFYIESAMFGIPFDGLHAFTETGAIMQIKVASLLQVVDARGEKMDQGETVTMFNDMCLLAPPTLISPAIEWETVDPVTVRARFTHMGKTIGATLTFDEEGRLVNFVSGDRFLSSDGKSFLNVPWSTPVGEYREFGGRTVAGSGEAIWQMPQGEFCYAKFELADIEYNCRGFR